MYHKLTENNAIPLYVSSNQSLIEVNKKMDEEYGKFSTDWERMPGEAIEYRKKVGLFVIIARVEEKLCEKCDEQHPGYVFKTIDNSGKDVENSEVYWCPKCGGMTPENYEKFVRAELLFGGGD